MEEIVKQITDKWKTLIESTIVDGYSRKVESINFFRMDKYYTGYPEIEFCYKVTFNFEDGISDSIYSNVTNPYIDATKEKWHKRIEIINSSIQDFVKSTNEKFSLIVSNPLVRPSPILRDPLEYA